MKEGLTLAGFLVAPAFVCANSGYNSIKQQMITAGALLNRLTTLSIGMAQPVGKILLMTFFIYLYYNIGKKQIFRLSRPVARYLVLARRNSQHDLENLVELIVAGISHFAFCIFLIWFTGLTLADLGLYVNPSLMILGIILGVGEMVLSSLLCRVTIEIVRIVAPKNAPVGLRDWLTVSRAGWMRHHIKTAIILPLPVALCCSSLNVIGEEIVFRGVMLHYFQALGVVQSVLVATLLFAAMQTFLMPSWHAALFPAIGALVMGIVHGCLYITVPCLPPLIVAHVAFFAFSIL